MIKEKLLDWKFYEKRFPLYFRESTHIMNHHRILYELLTALDIVYDDLFDLIDINKVGYRVNEGVLDALGNLYGIKRKVHIHYVTPDTTIVDKDVELNNDEFLLYIKSIIARNDFDGSRENLLEIYNTLRVPFILLNTNYSANAQLYIKDEGAMSANLIEVILSKLTLVESMGITYEVTTLDPGGVAKWDTNVWDDENAEGKANTYWGY